VRQLPVSRRVARVSYDEAVEEALCHGWIDSIIKRLDADRYLRKFTPCTSTGHWSAINLERLAKLERGVQPYVPLTHRPSGAFVSPVLRRLDRDRQEARDAGTPIAGGGCAPRAEQEARHEVIRLLG
jgi:hypothetical protein